MQEDANRIESFLDAKCCMEAAEQMSTESRSTNSLQQL
jgi:hypothetical protein